jgi:hypothetical protein
MEKSTSAGWLRFNGEDNLASLEKGITSELIKRADDKVHRDYVREASREAVAGFVKTWLLKRDLWGEDRFNRIVVAFPDDEAGWDSPSDHRQPSITLDGSGLDGSRKGPL